MAKFSSAFILLSEFDLSCVSIRPADAPAQRVTTFGVNMRNRKKDLPSLNYLQAFEAAAKHQSFAAASTDLGISESAISRKVRLLEEFYETPLFKRGHKSVALTRQGAALYKDVEIAMAALRDASAKLIANKPPPEITLAATNSVATLWLLPRLRRFNQAKKQLNIMLVSSDNDAECLGDEIDLTILRGDGDWPGHTSQKLFGEIIFPVCSPAFLERHTCLAQPHDLLDVPLVEVSSSHDEWMNWNEWLNNHLTDVPLLSKRTVFNAYPLAVQAAIDGLGVALGWGHLVDRHLSNGDLVRPLGRIYTRTDFGYYLLQRENIRVNHKRDVVKEWLMSESAARKAYPRPDVI